MKLNVVTTLYRSAGQLPEFPEHMSRAAAALEPDYELVLVNALAEVLIETKQRPCTIVRAVHRGGGVS